MKPLMSDLTVILSHTVGLFFLSVAVLFLLTSLLYSGLQEGVRLFTLQIIKVINKDKVKSRSKRRHTGLSKNVATLHHYRK